MQENAEKKKARRDVIKAIGIATGTILLIIGLIIAIRQIGIR